MGTPGYELAVQSAKPKFTALATQTNVSWEAESGYALQQIKKNDKLQECPIDTIKDSVTNVAAIGLSLNPAEKLAYLVPRDGNCCLDVSYQGLVKLATDGGIVEWAKAVLVREGDEFEWFDFQTIPKHKDTEPFNTKREVIGAFCVAKLKTSDEQYMVEKMSRDELDEVKASSKAKNGPWKTWPEEMMKKTIIKRASKSWPKSDGSRFHEAVHMINEHEGVIERDITEDVSQVISDEQLGIINENMAKLGTSPKWALKFCTAFEIDNLADLPADRFVEFMERLHTAIAAKQSKDAPQHEEAEEAEIIEGEVVEETAIPEDLDYTDDDKNEMYDALSQLYGTDPYEGTPDPDIQEPLEDHWGRSIEEICQICGYKPPEDKTDANNAQEG